jgi:hypothetical protein
MSNVINYSYTAPTKPSKKATKKPSTKASTRRTRKGKNADWKAKPSSDRQHDALLQRFGLPKSFTKGLTAGQAADLRLLGVDVRKGRRVSDVTIGFADAPASRIKSLTGITKATFLVKCKALDAKGNPSGDPRTAKNQSSIGDRKVTRKAKPSSAKSYGLTAKGKTEVIDLIDTACRDGRLKTCIDDETILDSIKDNSEAIAKLLAEPILALLEEKVGQVEHNLEEVVKFLNDKVVPHIKDVEAEGGKIVAKVERKRSRK